MPELVIGSIVCSQMPIPAPPPLIRVLPKPIPLIGLTGPSGSGKDLVASLLSMVGYQYAAFGQVLREEIGESFSGIDCGLPLGNEIYQDWRKCKREGWEVLWAKPTPPHVRRLLQFWGSELRRAEDPNYWVNKLSLQIAHGKAYAIPDVRFENEAEFIHGAGGEVWWINRPNRPSQINGLPDHVSEQFHNVRISRTIPNNGHLCDLAAAVRKALREARKV